MVYEKYLQIAFKSDQVLIFYLRIKLSLSLQSNQMRKQVNSKAFKQFGDYLIGKTIGQGTFGKVKSAIHKPTNQNVAIKILQKSKITEVSDVERVSRQIHILKLIRHPNIVQLYQIIQTPKQLFLVMQYMEKGELFDYIVQNKRIPQQQAVRMFHQLISGVEYIHKIGVVHRDLKPENILLDYKKAIRIVDFGLSNTYKKGELLKTPCGSPCYAAPEMIKGQKYDGLRVDIWSCGVILFAMLCGYLPFEDPDTPSLYKKILSGSYIFHKSLSQDAKDLINSILTGNQSDRFTIQQVRGHRWMYRHQKKDSCDGIIVGINKIPIDRQVLYQMKTFNLDPDYVSKCLDANRHNNATTTYYLWLKKFISEGGQTSCDLSSKSFDKSLIQVNRRKRTNTNILIDNFFTKSTENQVIVRRKSKEKSRQKIDNRADKQNRCSNIPISFMSSINTESKKTRITNKSKANDSFNYGRVTAINKSIEKNGAKRQSMLENRINRKYKEKFNQSLVSKSRDKCTQRSRVNSSLMGLKKQLQPAILCDDGIKITKNKKNVISSLKCETTKMQTLKAVKARRI